MIWISVLLGAGASALAAQVAWRIVEWRIAARAVAPSFSDTLPFLSELTVMVHEDQLFLNASAMPATTFATWNNQIRPIATSADRAFLLLPVGGSTSPFLHAQ
jgi:hypothetical protein